MGRRCAGAAPRKVARPVWSICTAVATIADSSSGETTPGNAASKSYRVVVMVVAVAGSSMQVGCSPFADSMARHCMIVVTPILPLSPWLLLPTLAGALRCCACIGQRTCHTPQHLLYQGTPSPNAREKGASCYPPQQKSRGLTDSLSPKSNTDRPKTYSFGLWSPAVVSRTALILSSGRSIAVSDRFPGGVPQAMAREIALGSLGPASPHGICVSHAHSNSPGRSDDRAYTCAPTAA